LSDDKKNISIKNPEFKKALQQYLKLWNEDMEKDNFERIIEAMFMKKKSPFIRT